jgi:hypothetical protein
MRCCRARVAPAPAAGLAHAPAPCTRPQPGPSCAGCPAAMRADGWAGAGLCCLPRPPHLWRGYFGSRVRLSVFGRWNTTEKRGFRCLAHVFFFTALAALAAVALASLPAGSTHHDRGRRLAAPAARCAPPSCMACPAAAPRKVQGSGPAPAPGRPAGKLLMPSERPPAPPPRFLSQPAACGMSATRAPQLQPPQAARRVQAAAQGGTECCASCSPLGAMVRPWKEGHPGGAEATRNDAGRSYPPAPTPGAQFTAATGRNTKHRRHTTTHRSPATCDFTRPGRPAPAALLGAKLKRSVLPCSLCTLALRAGRSVAVWNRPFGSACRGGANDRARECVGIQAGLWAGGPCRVPCAPGGLQARLDFLGEGRSNFVAAADRRPRRRAAGHPLHAAPGSPACAVFCR